MRTGLPRGARSGSALPVTKEAAGARTAWYEPSNQPPNDHAVRATLGRRRRPRRPVMRSAPGITAPASVSGNAPLTRFSHRAPRECPLKRCLGPKRAAIGKALHPKIGLRRHVRPRPKPRTHKEPDPRSFEAQRQGPSRTRKPRLHRGAGFDIVPDRPQSFAALPAQWRYRAPPGSAMRSAVPATR